MTTQLTPFGKPMLKHWLFDPSYKNLNHGSSDILIVSEKYSYTKTYTSQALSALILPQSVTHSVHS